MWISWCLFNSDGLRKLLSQILQWKGFTLLVCIFIWCFLRAPGRLKLLSQYLQWNGFPLVWTHWCFLKSFGQIKLLSRWFSAEACSPLVSLQVTYRSSFLAAWSQADVISDRLLSNDDRRIFTQVHLLKK